VRLALDLTRNEEREEKMQTDKKERKIEAKRDWAKIGHNTNTKHPGPAGVQGIGKVPSQNGHEGSYSLFKGVRAARGGL